MSHFAVLVIGDNFEEQLAPYDEDLSVDPYWTDTDWITAKDVDLPEESSLEEIVAAWRVKYPKEAEEENLRIHEGSLQRLSRYNPNSKWDWYQVGGRWRGFFKVKKDALVGAEATLGAPGTFGNKPDFDADSVRKGMIDFEGMREARRVEAEREYDRYETAIAGTPEPRSWEEVRTSVEDINEARRIFREQPRVAALHKAEFFFVDDADFGTREEYVTRYVAATAVPYAVVKDGEWHSKGDMGWWGVSRNETSQDEWNQKVQELYDSLPDDTLLTLVDCHI